SGSQLSYGLGVGISDFDGDGWADFYVSNDYNVPDYLYLNNQNGTFRNALPDAIGHTSQFSMGNDVADLNNDGLPDLITLDMLPEDNARQKLLLAPDNYGKFDLNLRSGFYFQFMRNMLHLNNGNWGGGVAFSEIGQYAGISNTDWSWSALAADYDNDGWRDLYVTNGYNRDYTNLDFINYMDDYVAKKGRLVREDVLEIIKNMPASDVMNYMFRGSENLKFEQVNQAWGMAHISNSNGAAYSDLDNDGDLDLIVNNINNPAFIYENTSGKNERNYLQIQLSGAGGNTQGIGVKVNVYAGGRQYFSEQYPARGYLSAVSDILHIGLGNAAKIDSLIVTWQSGKRQKRADIEVNSRVKLEEKNAEIAKPIQAAISPIFSPILSPIEYFNSRLAARDFDRQKLLISQLSTHSPCMATGDLNGDGLEDFFIGGAAGQSASVYFQTKNGGFVLSKNPAFEQDKKSEAADAIIFDANDDGHPDIFIASGGYHNFQPNDPLLQDRLYLNDGKGVFKKSTGALPNLPGSKGCAAAADLNNDGHLDLFVGGRVVPGRYPETPFSSIFLNDGKGNFSDQTAAVAPELASLGMVCDAAWADVSGDGQSDLIVAGEWLPVSIFVNNNGKLKNETAAYLGKNYSGFWNRIAVADLNNDNKPDFIVGNLGTNTQIRASEAQPAELYFSDFDKNGSVDPVLCFYIQGESYPYLTRDELLGQMSFFRQKYTSYKNYSTATLEELFSKSELSKAGHLIANHLETSVFLSNATGKYDILPLPAEAQYSPIHAIHILDFDKDGNQDLLLCGNNNNLKLRLGKADANYGMLFRGDGKGAFKYIDQMTSGLRLKGDVRSISQ
ncbi:MAG: VCBS repeat-containing protein, partial [Bacteroidota bacterium]